nr:hypothetical protein [Candidatus Cloacimonadota bacterium]
MEKYPNINILLNLPQHYIPKAEFVLRTYCYILRLNPKFIYGTHFEAAHLYYGPPPDREYPMRILYDPETADFFERQDLYPLEKVNFCKFQGHHIPFLFSQVGSIYSFTDETCVLRKDVIAGGFYFLTCWHEYVFTQRGITQSRFEYKQSLQYQWDFAETPVVDVYIRIILSALDRVLPEYVRDVNWKKEFRFSMGISHDIDYWNFWDSQTFRKVMRYNLHSLHTRPFAAIYKIIGHLIHKKLIYNHFKLLSKIKQKEQKLGVKSTWFLMGSSNYEDDRQNYITSDTYREEIVNLLADQDIGLHGSPESAFDPDVLERELKNLRDLGFKPRGFRTHYLHFEYQKSFAILESKGIQYDSTLGYWENIGFRAGISFPFYPFNIAENRPFRVLEIPLIVMDTSLNSRKAMNKSYSSAHRSIKRLIQFSSRYQSHLSVLWHNTTFDPIDYPMWGKLYWRTIRNAKAAGAWVTSLSDIYDEWVK